MIGNIEFYGVLPIDMVLHDIQRYVLLHVTTNLTNLLCSKGRERSTSQSQI